MSARLAAFYFAYFAYVGASMPYLPLYLAWRGLRPEAIAVVVALPPLARVFAPAAWGWMAERSGALRGLVAVSCAAIVACFALLPSASGLAAIAALIGLTGALSSGALPLVEAITLGSLAGHAGRYGPIRLWGSVGFILAVLAGGAWLGRFPVRTLPGVLLAIALGLLAAAALLPGGHASAARKESEVASGGLRAGVPALIGAGFLMSAAHGALYAFYTLHLSRLGYGSPTIGALWTLGVLAEIAVFFWLPALFHRYRLSTILVASCACAAVRFTAIGWGGALLSILALAQLLHAATFGSFHGAAVAAVQRLFPPGALARGQALFSSLAYGAGGASGALVAGWAWHAGGPRLVFSLAAAAGMAGGVLAGRLKRAGL